MHRRGSLFWGSILIVLAGLLLLKQMGVIVGDIFGYFWPLLIIAFGIWLIVGFFARNRPVEGEQVSIPLEERTSAFIKLDHGAGRLTLHSGAGSSEIINGTFGNGLSYKSHVEGSRIGGQTAHLSSILGHGGRVKAWTGTFALTAISR